MENNITPLKSIYATMEYWKNNIQKESGIPPYFFEIINIQELYTNKQKAKIKKIRRHIKHKLTVKQNIFIRKINKKYQKNNNGKLFFSSNYRRNKLLISMLYSADKINNQVNSINSMESPSVDLKYCDYIYEVENTIERLNNLKLS